MLYSKKYHPRFLELTLNDNFSIRFVSIIIVINIVILTICCPCIYCCCCFLGGDNYSFDVRVTIRFVNNPTSENCGCGCGSRFR